MIEQNVPRIELNTQSQRIQTTKEGISLNKRFLIALISILLIGSIIINTYFATQWILNADEPLQKKVINLQNQLSTLEEQITLLQNNFNQLKNPNIITSLGVSDVREEPYRLYIAGRVGNYGFNTAYNVSLNVTLFRNNLIVKKTIIDIGSIDGGSSVYLIENIRYTGSNLSNWTITPQYNQ